MKESILRYHRLRLTLRNGETFVSYEVRTQSDLSVFEEKEFFVRRRYSDFEMLHNILSRDYSGYAIPPVPRKHTVTSFSGGSLSPIFIARRMHSLQTFLDRCIAHPVISTSMHMYQFLENESWKFYYHNAWMQAGNANIKPPQGVKSERNLEKPFILTDPYPIDVQENAKRILENCETDLQKLAKACAHHMSSLQAFPSETTISKDIYAFYFDDIASYFGILKKNNVQLLNAFQANILTSIQDLEDYLLIFKSLVKQREQKQKTFETVQFECSHRPVMPTSAHKQQLIHDNANDSQTSWTKITIPSQNKSSSLFTIPKFLRKKKSISTEIENPVEALKLCYQDLQQFDEKLDGEMQFLRERLDTETRRTLQLVCDNHVNYFTAILESLNS
ncbi:autophagy associated protein [Schizosaccharomyces cryophilus OY26]|uniref:Autophagy associated protein n=1 Tax=Schizosaccharomyces cryophilus (strain OY26 / ATCC MYA-4695 / CBS 11777 / NBRC 106824 / NRRL Y48691) TaxID=653667 RepID=S9VNK4_SCHCR|nr:autophagy associated protein [Schizosaccharomyces cryophilus OY26]EPY49543.1 autophagy associated protein [Schizosaccharomyces cryophilus OY26]